ncbi:MAG: hypothetical protein WCA89_07545 [Terracidiphilus sp.]|jgi:hypothetical protein
MNKRKMLFGLLLFCIGGLAVYGQPSPLKVEIKPAQTVVKNNEVFSVDTTIRNTSSAEQSLQVLYCCYSTQWTADNPLVHVDCAESCMHNFPHKTKLKPGDAYEKTVLVRVALAAGKGQSETVTFRLGFEDPTYGTVTTYRGVSRMWIPPRWSNAVTVSVTR